MATTKKRAIKHTQKEMRKECNYFTTKKRSAKHKKMTVMQEMRDFKKRAIKLDIA